MGDVVVTYYKATRPDGTDFRTGTVHYEVGATITHPTPHKRDASGYLSVATVPTDCTGSSWPLRLFEVTAADVWKDGSFPNKRCTHALTVVREVEAHVALGPQGRELVALIGRCGALTSRELWELAAARDAAGDAAWAAAWDAARDAAGAAAWAAVRALTVRDLIGDTFTQAHYDALTGPWRKTLGPLHPDDTDIREVTQ